MEQVLHPANEALITLLNSIAIKSVDTQCMEGMYYHIQDQMLSKTIIFFSPRTVFTALSSTLKASQ